MYCYVYLITKDFTAKIHKYYNLKGDVFKIILGMQLLKSIKYQPDDRRNVV